MQAKLISLNDVRVGDEVIIIHQDGQDWHGVVKELSPVETLLGGVDDEFGRDLTLACEEGEKGLLVIDGDPIYLIDRPPSPEEMEKGVAEACRKIAEIAASEPVRYLSFENDYGATIVRSDDMEGRCLGCGHRDCDCWTISWFKRVKNRLRNK